MKRFYFVFILIILSLPNVIGQQGHIKLLAVTEVNNTYKGSIADLYLDIVPGSGRVFLETFPLTKFDTQISTRFAKEIACSYVDIDCSKYDFFYTINANSPIIAGASAGSSIAVLTASLLKGYEIDEEVATTGTINSGGVVGPVGGLKEKIEAAKDEGLTKVLIPSAGKIFITDNQTTDAVNFSADAGIEIIEVSTLSEAMKEFTGKESLEDVEDLEISGSYTDTMKHLSSELCRRAEILRSKLSKMEPYDNGSIIRAENLIEKSINSTRDGLYYSSASYCYGAAIEYSYLLLSSQNLSNESVIEKRDTAKKSIQSFDEVIRDAKIKTITDLEAYMIVVERLIEADDYLENVVDNKENSIRNLAYSIERLNSAKYWAEFFDNRGKEFELDEQSLEESCKLKLMEAEERYQYVNLYFPSSLITSRKEIDYAYSDLAAKNYVLCIFKASKAKANLDIVLSSFYVDEDQVRSILRQKLDVVKNSLLKQTKSGVFPILGYSYYEYAEVLAGYDLYSALLYSEYALEFSNLDVYFKEKNAFYELFKYVDDKLLLIFLGGIITGLTISVIAKKPSRTSPAGKKR